MASMEDDVKKLFCAGNAQTLVKFLIFGYNHPILEYSPMPTEACLFGRLKRKATPTRPMGAQLLEKRPCQTQLK